MDIKKMFLHRELEELIFTKQPKDMNKRRARIWFVS